jgi:multidrug efflux pump subunit AcrA (membrane-fusion protein)
MVEEHGVKVVEVVVPGRDDKLRLQHFEWLIARHLDGASSDEEVAAWAHANLAVQPEEAHALIEKLRTEGLLAVQAPGRVTDESRRIALMQTVGAPAAPPPPAATATASPEPALATMKEFFRKPVADEEEHAQEPRRSSALSSAVLSAIGIIAVLAALPLIIYFTFLRPEAVSHVHVETAHPHDLVQLYDGAGKVARPPVQALAFTVAGKIARVLDEKTRVKAGDAVAELAADAQADDELGHLRRRQSFYEHQLASATDPVAVEAARAKVAEKAQLIAAAEAHQRDLTLHAPVDGTITRVVAPVGSDVASGAPVVELIDDRRVVVLGVPNADGAFHAGQAVTLMAGDNPLIASVGTVEGSVLILELAPDAKAQFGDEVRLLRARTNAVVTVPPAAVVRRGGVSTVFVLPPDGKVAARTVTVVDRRESEVLVTGLADGEAYVVDPPRLMQNGDRATTEP